MIKFKEIETVWIVGSRKKRSCCERAGRQAWQVESATAAYNQANLCNKVMTGDFFNRSIINGNNKLPFASK